MNKHFLSDFPSPEELKKRLYKAEIPVYREANGHIHTPYSFSAFPAMKTLFEMAASENIKVLGINDFFVTDGYEAFAKGCLDNRIFPLFNIEFIGLLKQEQQQGIRINDPNNPGRIYFSGKGLDYPFSPGFLNRRKINNVVRESQIQIREMIAGLNRIIEVVNPSLSLTYEDIRKRYAKELVRERHLARAVRDLAAEKFSDGDEQLNFIESLYGGKKSKAGIENHSLLENEIRSNLLKSGGAAFVEEKESSFMELKKIIKIIHSAGGIPCYPVLLDDAAGKLTEYENDPEKLYKSLSALKVDCIELIPGRNSISVLREFVEFFHKKNFLVTFGTEHNTPELVPLTVTARGTEPLGDELKQIAWEGVCLIAAHQYLRAHGRQGYVLPDGKPSSKQKRELSLLGQMVIEYFLLNHLENEKPNK